MRKIDKSRHIEGLDYNSGDQVLRVLFKNGSSKRYAAVPLHVYQEMCDSASIGKYFHNVIKLHYRLINDADKNT